MPISIHHSLLSRFITCSVVACAFYSGAAQAIQPKIRIEGDATYALDDVGRVWKWGVAAIKEIPDRDSRDEPGPVMAGNGFVAIRQSDTLDFAQKVDGSVWQWGNGLQTPALVDNGFVSFAIYNPSYNLDSNRSMHTLALKADGSLWAWGNNQLGQLGDGTTTNRTTPVQIGTDFKSISTSESQSFGIKNDGSLWFWGTEYRHQENDASVISKRVINCLFDNECPTTTISKPTMIGMDYSKVALYSWMTVAMKTDGSVWAWGLDEKGIINRTNTPLTTPPIKIGDDKKSFAVFGGVVAMLDKHGALSLRQPWSTDAGYLTDAEGTNNKFSQILIGNRYSYSSGYQLELIGLKSDGGLWRFHSEWQQIGEGYSQITASDNSYLALKRDGTLWSWGYDLAGQLGNGPAESYNIVRKPIRIGADYVDLTGAIALKNDGSLWYAENVKPAFPESRGRIAPPFVAVNGNRYGGFAVGADRSLWAWGSFHPGGGAVTGIYFGEQPTQINTDIASLSTHGANHASLYTLNLIKTDGTFWKWGDLGAAFNSSISNRPSYTQSVLVNHGYVSVSGDLALRSDGSLWSIVDGQSTRFDPVTGEQLPYIDGFIETRLGEGYQAISSTGKYTLALKKDGSVWSWGNNDYGQLGDGTVIKREVSNPALVGTDFVAVFAEGCSSYAIHNDGQLFAWGCNNEGQLGDGTTVNQSRPLDIGFYIGTQGFMRGNLPLPAATPRAAPANSAPSFSQLPIFAPSYYRLRNRDVDQVFGDNTAALTQHWLQNGLAERREGSILFDSVWYLQRHPDLLKAFGGDTVTAATHFAQSGIKEARESSPAFSLALYKAYNPDLVAAFGDNHAAYFEHFSKAGAGECRTASAFFNARFYLSANPDVAKAFNNDCALALVHWLDHGRAEGRQASPTAMPIYSR